MDKQSLTYNVSVPPEFIQAVGDYIIERLKPLLKENIKETDNILDVKGVAAYLNVDENWIYQRTRKHEIPFIKKGKYCLFRKAVIDTWLNQDAVKPVTAFSISKKYR